VRTTSSRTLWPLILYDCFESSKTTFSSYWPSNWEIGFQGLEELSTADLWCQAQNARLSFSCCFLNLCLVVDVSTYHLEGWLFACFSLLSKFSLILFNIPEESSINLHKYSMATLIYEWLRWRELKSKKSH